MLITCQMQVHHQAARQRHLHRQYCPKVNLFYSVTCYLSITFFLIMEGHVCLSIRNAGEHMHVIPCVKSRWCVYVVTWTSVCCWPYVWRSVWKVGLWGQADSTNLTDTSAWKDRKLRGAHCRRSSRPWVGPSRDIFVSSLAAVDKRNLIRSTWPTVVCLLIYICCIDIQ
jgi:hypothetical protein